MKPTPFAITRLFCTLCLTACAGGEEEESATTSGGGITTIAPTTSSGSSSSQGPGGEESSTSDGSTTDALIPCSNDEECPSGDICEDGFCGLCLDCCGEAVLEIKITTPNMVLVVDKSGSMVANSWDSDADPNTPMVTRWFSLHQVVEFIVSDFGASINLGMQLFPSLKAKTEYNNNACLVEMTPEVPVAAENGAKVLSALPPASAMAQISGGTPSRLGLQAAIAHLESIDDGLPKFIAFITDGAANCSPEGADPLDTGLLFETYDDQLLGVVEDAASKGIGVFVVGIDTPNELTPVKPDGNPDGVNPFAKLNELAIAGGFPKNDPSEQFYNAQNQIELQAALVGISETVLSCVIALDPVPVFPNYVEVKVDAVDYGNTQVTDCATQDGWMYTSPAKDEIELCGVACMDFQKSGKLDAQYKCKPLG
jgi:hypothetical protein